MARESAFGAPSSRAGRGRMSSADPNGTISYATACIACACPMRAHARGKICDGDIQHARQATSAMACAN
jgi:hypothetical protein